MMFTMTKSVISTILLLVFCWSGPVSGARNKLISTEETKVYEFALAPTPSHKNETSWPLWGKSACKEWVSKWNYTCEEHNVTTKDGHILSMQRIPQGRETNSSKTPASKPAVIIQHGVLMDGMSWVLLENDSLPFVLADNGFDVWLNNNRGTRYSRHHLKLKPSDKEYWDWSWQDLSEIDLDATISYVHKKTGQKVHYVGHSMGTLMALIGLASNQPYTKKMRSAALLSPIAYQNLCTSIFGRISSDFFLADFQEETLNVHEFNPMGPLASAICLEVCKLTQLCTPSLWAFTGPNCCIDPPTFNRFLEVQPNSISTKSLRHLAQCIRGDGKIKKFDYGPDENKKRYNQETPPHYDLKKIPKDFPLYLAYGGTDTLSDVLDVLRLIDDLKDHKTVKTNFKLFYAHMDYQMAHQARKDVYEPVAEFFKAH